LKIRYLFSGALYICDNLKTVSQLLDCLKLPQKSH
jgi:hypothetical protein